MALTAVSDHEAQASTAATGSGAPAPNLDGLLPLVRSGLEDMKAEDLVEIDLAGKTSIADAMIVATGRSDRHVGAIADRIIKDLKDNGYGTARVEGLPTCDWVLIDTGDIIVHVFRPEVRSFYNLEKMWGETRPAEANGG